MEQVIENTAVATEAKNMYKALQDIINLKYEPGRSRTYIEEILSIANRSVQLATYTANQPEEANATLIAASKDMYRALKVLAELDLTGVTGDIIYQRNKSKILVKDVLAAIEAINKATPKK
mgnify:CR=1 FL=1